MSNATLRFIQRFVVPSLLLLVAPQPACRSFSAGHCAQRAEQLSDWAQRVVMEGDGAFEDPPDGFHPVQRDDLPPWERDGSVFLGPDTTHIAGQPSSDEQLFSVVKNRRELSEKIGRSPFEPSLQIDARVPWQRLIAVQELLLRAHIEAIQLVFEHRSQLAPPPASSRSAWLHRHRFDTTTPGILLDPQWRGSPLYPCRERLGPELGDVHLTLKARARALASCGCSVNPAAVREAYWLQLHRDLRAPRSAARLRLANDAADSYRLALAAKTPWVAAQAHLVAAARNHASVRLAIAPPVETAETVETTETR